VSRGPVALGLALGLLGAACASDPPAATTHRRAIIGGTSDPTHPAVVALTRASTGGLCSGVVVAPRLVLTAAHCVADATAADVTVVLGEDVAIPDATATAAELIVYPTVTDLETAMPGGIDLGFVVVGEDLGVAPLALAPGAAPGEGETVTLVGYGDDAADVSGLRRTVDLPVDALCPRLLGAGDETGNACTGDSGGAVLHGDALVAVISHGRAGCTAPTQATRVDVHRAWLEAVIAAGAAVDCPGCLAPDPECPLTPPGDAGVEDAGIDPRPHDPGCATGGSPGSPIPWLWLLAALAALRRRAYPT